MYTVTKQCLATLHLPLLQFLFCNVASAICKSSGYLILGIKGSGRSIPMQYLGIRLPFPLSSHQGHITLQDNTQQLKRTNQKLYLLTFLLSTHLSCCSRCCISCTTACSQACSQLLSGRN